ncbi:MAG: hypothetical protein AAF802_25300 [Planctomycetota bacterium]
MEQVLKMVEGGQLVPALDMLRSILDRNPDAAWAFAIRGRLLISLQELDSLTENAERFIRLQPSNPMALAQRAASLVFQGDVQSATDSMLEALNESGLEVDSFLMDTAMLVATGLAQQGVLLSARTYAMLTVTTDGYEEGMRSRQFLAELDGTPGINHLLKTVPALMERPDDASWGERYDEAEALLKSNKVLSAQDKLESLRRTAPMQPAVISGLLQCAVWRGDLERQAEMASQLSEIDSLEEPVRQKFGALAAILAESKNLAVQTRSVRVVVDDIEQAEMAIIAHERSAQIQNERVKELRVPGIEIPPRSVFHLLSDNVASEEPTYTMGVAAVFGKQTDGEAQIVALDVVEDRIDDVKALLAAFAPGGNVSMDEPLEIPLLRLSDDKQYEAEPPKSIAEMIRKNREFDSTHKGKRLCEMPLPLLRGKTLSEAADDDSLLSQRTHLVRLLECEESIMQYPEALEFIYKAANVQPLPKLTPNDLEGGFEPSELNRIDPANLDAASTVVLANFARGTGCKQACFTLASAALDKTADSDDKDTPQIRNAAYSLLIYATPLPGDAAKLCDEAVGYAKTHQLDFSNILIGKLELCMAQADQAGFTSAIQEIEANYGSDPNVMARVQSLLVHLGVLRPDGSLRGQPAAAPGGPSEFTPAAPPEQRSEGLWTPDSPSPTPSPQQDSGKKLWVPGMD